MIAQESNINTISMKVQESNINKTVQDKKAVKPIYIYGLISAIILVIVIIYIILFSRDRHAKLFILEKIENAIKETERALKELVDPIEFKSLSDASRLPINRDDNKGFLSLYIDNKTTILKDISEKEQQILSLLHKIQTRYIELVDNSYKNFYKQFAQERNLYSKNNPQLSYTEAMQKSMEDHTIKHNMKNYEKRLALELFNIYQTSSKELCDILKKFLESLLQVKEHYDKKLKKASK